MRRAMWRFWMIAVELALASSHAVQAESQQSARIPAAATTDEASKSPSSACTALVEPSWQKAEPAEENVWLTLCAGKVVDLSKISDAGVPLKADEIFTDPSRLAMLKDARIHISNGTVDDFTLNGLAGRSLTLSNITITKNLVLHDNTFSDTVVLENVHVGGTIDIKNVIARRFSQILSSVQNSYSVQDSRLDKLSIDQCDDPNINLFTSQIGEVEISKIGNSNVKLWSDTGTHITVVDSGKITISLSQISVTSNIRLVNDLWSNSASAGEPPIVLSYVAGREFFLLSAQPPKLGVEHAKFDMVSFGPDPVPAVEGIVNVGHQDQSLEGPQYLPFLAAAARNYAANGQSDVAQEINYKINLQNKPVDTWGRGFWWLRRVTVGFGQRVEWGIYWTIALVVIGSLVFRKGSQALVDPNTRPNSWMLFAIDTVIPVIHLDRRHDDVAFNGWRQWYLGFLRAMGAVLVFLVFYFLQQVLVGSESTAPNTGL
jgi:hypothetical protein